MAKNDALIQSQAATLKNLENQMGQLATKLHSRLQGAFLSDTENLKILGKEHFKVVELRNGNTLEPKKVVVEDEPTGKEESQPTVEVPITEKLDAEKSDEALEQIPNYVKFMKDILSKKKRLSKYGTVTLTKECSAFLQNKLPLKLKDPGSFKIPCNIGESY
ncbi:uncharacterized protein [Gossypium hirsutum]|uniref:Uncharacterized protein n=1 Tax=Gossypium hirsutum TaxID=3635 RepID=A0A1U8P745_GOSHI|nr:uncharacterized protein LOC107955744 [Gossypium hirsutum]XP_040966509.1 uncharacterized protein LOC121227600 [Gossypium hirsutum]